jgi:hypothetical protein
VAGLVNAAEAAPDGTRKLAAALHRREDAAKVPAIGTFTSMQLDLALGRSNVIHAALLAGPESDTFLARATRLDRSGPARCRHARDRQITRSQIGWSRRAGRRHDEHGE